MKRFGCLVGLVWMLVAGVVQAQELIPATLNITVDPVATISLNYQQEIRGNICTKKFPDGGEVLIKVSEPGYRTEYRTVRLDPGMRHNESFKLKREPIPVLFRSNTSATVLCNGSALGVTPFYYFFDDPKTYRIIFRSEKHQQNAPLNLDLTDGRPRVVDQNLVSDFGTVQVETVPAGAKLFVNGIDRGVTPCNLSDLRAGNYKIQLRAEGYQDLSHELKLEAGRSESLKFALERLPATLQVATIPQNARVYVDDVFRGESDLTLSDLPSGTHRIRVIAEGYATATRMVTLKAGATHVEEFELVIVRGTLAVNATPAVVEVYNGKRLIGKTTPAQKDGYNSDLLRLSLIPGEHEITFKADGYADLTKKVSITANTETPIEVHLKFKPNLELVTKSGVHRGVLVRQNANGVTIELKPGYFRTFLNSEIVSRKLLKD